MLLKKVCIKQKKNHFKLKKKVKFQNKTPDHFTQNL